MTTPKLLSVESVQMPDGDLISTQKIILRNGECTFSNAKRLLCHIAAQKAHIATLTQQRDDATDDNDYLKRELANYKAQYEEAHRRLDAAGIPPAAGAECNDPACNSHLVHRVHCAIEQLTEAKAEVERLRGELRPFQQGDVLGQADAWMQCASRLFGGTDIEGFPNPSCGSRVEIALQRIDWLLERARELAAKAPADVEELAKELRIGAWRIIQGVGLGGKEEPYPWDRANDTLKQDWIALVQAVAARLGQQAGESFEIDNETTITLRQDNDSRRCVTVWASRHGVSQGIIRITSDGISRISMRSETLAIALEPRSDCVRDIRATLEVAELRKQAGERDAEWAEANAQLAARAGELERVRKERDIYRGCIDELEQEYTGTEERAKSYRWSLTRIGFAKLGAQEFAHQPAPPTSLGRLATALGYEQPQPAPLPEAKERPAFVCPVCKSGRLTKFIMDGRDRTHCNACGANNWSECFKPAEVEAAKATKQEPTP